MATAYDTRSSNTMRAGNILAGTNNVSRMVWVIVVGFIAFLALLNIAFKGAISGSVSVGS